MPELPEVENVRLGLLHTVVGQHIVSVSIRRPDVIHGPRRPNDLLSGRTVAQIERSGKQLALQSGCLDDRKRANNAPCVCVHLGMTGSLRYYTSGIDFKPDLHTHVIWRLENGGQMAFRDPRRFGGLWTYASAGELFSQRWSRLGEDALTITATQLHAGLQRIRRPMKAALLNQGLIAGLGNIYVDELLFACGLSPFQPASEISMRQVCRLVPRMRRLLRQAIRSGGSTLRDYVDVQGRSGGYQHRHAVYGRSGQPCPCCGLSLSRSRIAGRTTVWCTSCQACVEQK